MVAVLAAHESSREEDHKEEHSGRKPKREEYRIEGEE